MSLQTGPEELQKRYATYDFDHSLYDGEFFIHFIEEACARGILPAGEFDTQNNTNPFAHVVAFTTNIIGQEYNTAVNIATDVAREVSGRLFPWAYEQIEEVHAAGGDFWIVSSMPHFMTLSLAKALEIKGGHGSPYGQLDGILTSEITLLNKADCIRDQLMPLYDGQAPWRAAGDSCNSDYEMLLMAQQAFAVNPDANLRAKAQEHDWEIVDLAPKSDALAQALELGVENIRSLY